MKKICVLGLGYIGLPTAGMLAAHGYQIIGVDVNEEIVNTLNKGQVHIHEPGLQVLVQAGIQSEHLQAVLKPEPADVFIIAVPTPIRKDGADQRPFADLSYVEDAAASIVPHLRPGNLVILESTVPPRTTLDVLTPILEQSGLNVSQTADRSTPTGTIATNGNGHKPVKENTIYVAHCPERVLPGRIIEELSGNDRVIGGTCPLSSQMAESMYASFVKGKILITDATTAEIVKLMENTYRDVNIALANEFALVAEHIGINVAEAITLANHHPRVNILKPGPGVGGHCIAVDPWFIIQAASHITPLIQATRHINDNMPAHVVALVKDALAAESGKTIACLGLAYKADVDDARESPAVEVVHLLQASGFEVRTYDPFVDEDTVTGQVASVETAVIGADALVVLTDHSEFSQLTPLTLPAFTGQVIIDTRHILPTEAWESAGKVVWHVGNLPALPAGSW